MYYEQICNILKQNGIEAEHILWTDEQNGITLDNGEFPIIEYLIGEDEPQNLNYVWLLVQNGAEQEERGYTILRNIQLMVSNILILEETLLSPQYKDEKLEKDINE